MVVRPSLKRVVPGSVPPWRALCAESARALKAFFSVLCVCRRFLSLFCCSNPSSGRSRQILHALNLRAFWVTAFCPRVGRGRCWAMFFVAAPCFPLPAIKKARQPFIIVTLDQLSEHFRGRGRNALGFARRRTSKLAGRAATQPAPCAQKLAATLCPCNIPLAACQFGLFAARQFLQLVTYFVGHAAFDLLICAGVEAGAWKRVLGGWD